MATTEQLLPGAVVPDENYVVPGNLVPDDNVGYREALAAKGTMAQMGPAGGVPVDKVPGRDTGSSTLGELWNGSMLQGSIPTTDQGKSALNIIGADTRKIYQGAGDILTKPLEYLPGGDFITDLKGVAHDITQPPIDAAEQASAELTAKNPSIGSAVINASAHIVPFFAAGPIGDLAPAVEGATVATRAGRAIKALNAGIRAGTEVGAVSTLEGDSPKQVITNTMLAASGGIVLSKVGDLTFGTNRKVAEAVLQKTASAGFMGGAAAAGGAGGKDVVANAIIGAAGGGAGHEEGAPSFEEAVHGEPVRASINPFPDVATAETVAKIAIAQGMNAEVSTEGGKAFVKFTSKDYVEPTVEAAPVEAQSVEASTEVPPTAEAPPQDLTPATSPAQEGQGLPLTPEANQSDINLVPNFPITQRVAKSLSAAADDPFVSAVAKVAGIKTVTIDPPHTFQLSQQGAVTESGTIRIHPDAENAGSTFLHELGHVLWERSDDAQQAQLKDIVLVHREDLPIGYKKLNTESAWNEALAEVFTLDNLTAKEKEVLTAPRSGKTFEEAFPVKAALAITSAPKQEGIRTSPSGDMYVSQDANWAQLIKDRGDFSVIIKDSNGGRHSVPASIASKLLEDPVVAGHVRSVRVLPGAAEPMHLDDYTLNAMPQLRKAIVNKLLELEGSKTGQPDWLAQQADAARTRITNRNTNRLNAMLPLDNITDLGIIGAQKIRDGFNKFTGWSGSMLSDFGSGIKDVLDRVWTFASNLHESAYGKSGNKGFLGLFSKKPAAPNTGPLAADEQFIANWEENNKAGRSLLDRLKGTPDIIKKHLYGDKVVLDVKLQDQASGQAGWQLKADYNRISNNRSDTYAQHTAEINRIQDGLTPEEIDKVNQVIFARRAIEIASYKPKHTDAITKGDMQLPIEYLAKFAQREGMAQTVKLFDIADQKTDYLRSQTLTKLLTSGLMDIDTFLRLDSKGKFYIPFNRKGYTNMLDLVDPAIPVEAKFSSAGDKGIRSSGLLRLKEGDEFEKLRTDFDKLIADVATRVQARIQRNEVYKQADGLAHANEGTGFYPTELALNKDGTQKYKTASFGGKTFTTNNPKYVDPPKGFTAIEYMDNAVVKEHWVANDILRDYLSQDPVQLGPVTQIMQRVTSTLKQPITGALAPFRALFRTGFMDVWDHYWFSNAQGAKTYSASRAIFLPQELIDRAKSFKEAATFMGPKYEALLKEGMGPEHYTDSLLPGADKQNSWLKLGSYMNRVADTWDYMTVMQRLQKSNPGMSLDEVAYRALDYKNYARGGRFLKGVDRWTINYFNAAGVSAYGLGRTLKIDSSVRTAYKMSEGIAMHMGAALAMYYYMDKHGDKKQYDQLTDKQRIGYINIPLWFDVTNSKREKEPAYLSFRIGGPESFIAMIGQLAAQKIYNSSLFDKVRSNGPVREFGASAVWEGLQEAITRSPNPAGWLPYRLYTAALLGKDSFTGRDLHQGVPQGASAANSYVSAADSAVSGVNQTSPSVVAGTQALNSILPDGMALDPTHIEFYLNTLTGGGLLTSAMGAGMDRLVANSNKEQAQLVMQKFYDSVLRNKTIFTLGDKRNIPGEQMQRDKTAAEEAHAGNAEGLLQRADKWRLSGNDHDEQAVVDYIKSQAPDEAMALGTQWQDYQKMFIKRDNIDPGHLRTWSVVKNTPTNVGMSTVFADWYSKASAEDKIKIKKEIPFAIGNIMQAGNLMLEAKLVDQAQR